MKPHLVRWDKELAKKGLVVLDVDNGNRDSLDDLKADVEKAGIKFPVLWDKAGATCKQYGIKGYPAAFLIGVDGTVAWEGFPAPKVKELESLVEAELKKVEKKEK